MKRIMLVLIFFTTTCNVFGDCADPGILVWPCSEVLNKNPAIILSCYSPGIKKDVLSGLNKKYPVYLKSANELVQLGIIEVYTGSALLQVLLKPVSELKAGVEYELCIDSIPDSKSRLWIHKPNFRKQRTDPTPKWVVLDAKDEIAPVWLSTPKEAGKVYVPYCPSRIFVKFSCNFSDSSETIARLTVKNLTTGKECIYYAEYSSGIIIIGDFGCMPDFYFEKETNYEAWFSLMDASGNYSEDIDNKVQFFTPIPSKYQ